VQGGGVNGGREGDKGLGVQLAVEKGYATEINEEGGIFYLVLLFVFCFWEYKRLSLTSQPLFRLNQYF